MENRIVLVRHATTADTGTGKLCGAEPTPLDAAGRSQARALGRHLGDQAFSETLVSPVARATETAELAGLKVGAESCDALVEWNYGDLMGSRTDEVIERHPGWVLFADGAPGGEAPTDIARRLAPLIRRLDHASHDILVVGHGHVLRAVVATWLDLEMTSAQSFVIDPASITVLAHRRGKRVLVQLNDRAHLALWEPPRR